MPSILYHLNFANEVYNNLPYDIKVDKVQFLCGNLIPDMATDKSLSHYRKEDSLKGFYIPEMKLVKEELFSIDNPLKLGMYCHLYLDFCFIKNFLIPEFIWDYENMRVINPRNKKSWSTDNFFSENGMYGAYSEINHLLLRDKLVSLNLISLIPAFLPLTGIKVFDTRKEKNWKDELNEYLSIDKKYTGDIFEYKKLCYFIKKCAYYFIDEISHTIKKKE